MKGPPPHHSALAISHSVKTRLGRVERVIEFRRPSAYLIAVKTRLGRVESKVKLFKRLGDFRDSLKPD